MHDRGETSVNSRWVVTSKRKPSASLLLVCFPHAGAGASVYAAWNRELPATVDLCAVQPPGREQRMAEPFLTRMDELVAEATNALLPLLDRPCVFFGHSMGALVAFEVARELRRRGARIPVGLCVSAREAPQRQSRPLVPWDLPDPEFIEQIDRRYNGLPAALKAEPELLALFLPILRADLRLLFSYTYQAEPPLDVPLLAFGGEQDPGVSLDALQAWREQTLGRFSAKFFPGDHFYHQANRRMLLAALAQEFFG